VVKDELLSAHPGLARDIFDAFTAAKGPYLEELKGGTIAQPTTDDKFFRRVMDVIGDPLPYGIEPNRPMLDAIVRHAREQGIITRQFTLEELFPEMPSVAAAP
jgi:4,5-dihydroxyphthalate decarboxylase